MYKVSVVVPIYKVEDYIVRCAESLFNQTLDDMQFIFVDDGSPDNSIALLEQTIERFPQRKPPYDHSAPSGESWAANGACYGAGSRRGTLCGTLRQRRFRGADHVCQAL